MRLRARFFGHLLMRPAVAARVTGRNQIAARLSFLRFFLLVRRFLCLTQSFFQQHYYVGDGGIVQVESLGGFCFQAHVIGLEA